MRNSIRVGIALGALVALAACAPENAPAAHQAVSELQTPALVTSAPAAAQPWLMPYPTPYPEGQGDTDGLSRDPEDCDRGCIGGNPG